MFWIFKKEQNNKKHTITIDSEDRKYIDSIISRNLEIALTPIYIDDISPEDYSKTFIKSMAEVWNNFTLMIKFCKDDDNKIWYLIYKSQETICILWENWVRELYPSGYEEDEKWCENDDEVDSWIWIISNLYEEFLQKFSNWWQAIDTFSWPMRERLVNSHRWKILFKKNII